MMQHRPTLFTALLFALLVSPYVSKGQEVITIAHDGKTDYRIVQSKRATEPEKFAVEELATFLGRVTGARFPVVSEASLTGADAKQIYVGWTDHAAHNGIDTVNLGEEEWVIRTIGDGLVLTGGRPRGTMYAVYEFLEDQIGCHWLDRKTEVIPPKPTLDIGRLNIQAKPWFWLGYQLLVDPHQPVEPLIRTFMDGYFGAAGDAMRDYLRYLRKRIDADAQFKMLRDEPHKLAYLDLEFFQTSQKLFDEAEMQVEPDSLSAKHVAVERFTLDAALLYLWPWLERKLPAGKTLPFDREAVIQRYERGWQALVSSRYSRVYTRDKNSLNADGRLLERMVGLFRDSQLPEQFRDLPPRDVADFNWLTFSQIRPRQKFVPDDEAAGRMTATFTERNRIQKAEEGGDAPEVGENQQHRKPLVFGASVGKKPGDRQTITVQPEDIPQDGKYHLYRIGQIRVQEGTTVWALKGARLGVNVDRIFEADADNPAVNTWEAYISLKLQGPAYVRGSRQPNGVWMDRVLLIRSKSKGS